MATARCLKNSWADTGAIPYGKVRIAVILCVLLRKNRREIVPFFAVTKGLQIYHQVAKFNDVVVQRIRRHFWPPAGMELNAETGVGRVTRYHPAAQILRR